MPTILTNFKRVNSKHFRFPPFKINTTFVDHNPALSYQVLSIYVSKETFDFFKKQNQYQSFLKISQFVKGKQKNSQERVKTSGSNY